MSRFSWRAAVLTMMAAALSCCGPSGAPPPVAQTAAAAPPPIVERQRPAHAQTSHDLSEDEALGGHTLQRHVGKSDDDLRARLEREPQISSASTYTDRATAERVVGAALEKGSRAFTEWRERLGRRPNFALRYRADGVIGRSIARGHTYA